MDEWCALCTSPFHGNSRPRWAFTRLGIPAGRVHAGCANRSGPFLVAAVGEAFDDAHFRLWCFSIRGWENEDHSWDLRGLVHHPSETLSKTQQESLDRMRTRNKYSEAQIASLTSAHTALVREFWSWRSELGR